jgi:hypothetical protein
MSTCRSGRGRQGGLQNNFRGGADESRLAAQGIRVITGSPSQETETLVRGYLAGTLGSGPNVCDH